ncbi:uncharacterized protein SAPINGB_P005556 [Magnusiomyces paraingens]|uniref:LIM zinc-binding domain-containing protein n=1 Tax=Magnusiomyces paraingens TaxID=2606893 RepID=A0A5E8C0B2_9ASCO|nr:uncharacterized protein SAPINGB_P005556 [Saprochaete ingens]VVT57144.1 unnamed protein product [Saprochaete ingens]
MYSANPPPPLNLSDQDFQPQQQQKAQSVRSTKKSHLEQSTPWKTLDYAFPPFVPGVQLPSVYERAGFDVYREGSLASSSKPVSPISPTFTTFQAYTTTPQPPLSSTSPEFSIRSSGHSSSLSSSSSSSSSFPMPPRIGQMSKRPSLPQLEPISSFASTSSTSSSKKVPSLLRFLHKSPSNPSFDKASISNPICTSTSTFPITTIRVPSDGSGRFSSTKVTQETPTIKLNDLIMDESQLCSQITPHYQENQGLTPPVDDETFNAPYLNSNKPSSADNSSVGSTTPKTIKPTDTTAAETTTLEPCILTYSPTSVYSSGGKIHSTITSNSLSSQPDSTPPFSTRQSETDPSSVTSSLSSNARRLSSSSSIYSSAVIQSNKNDDYMKLHIGNISDMDMDKNYKSLIAPLSAMNLNVKDENYQQKHQLRKQDQEWDDASLPLPYREDGPQNLQNPLPLISRGIVQPLQNKTNLPPVSQGALDTRENLCLQDNNNNISTPITNSSVTSFPVNAHASTFSDYTSRSSSTTSSLFSAPLSQGSTESAIDSIMLPSPITSKVTLPLSIQQRPPKNFNGEPSSEHTNEPTPNIASIAPPTLAPPSHLASCATPTSSAPPIKHSKKGPCRGCGQVITGKSVSSRDGKLSGRWHRACFSCSGCGTQDFSLPLQVLSKLSSVESNSTETEFYILNDMPYCYLCYHTVNDSICTVCSLGVEGRCLDDGHSRYHAACAVCTTCSVPLVPDCGPEEEEDPENKADNTATLGSSNPSNSLIFVCNKLLYCAKHACELETLSNGNAPVEKRRTRQFFM